MGASGEIHFVPQSNTHHYERTGNQLNCRFFEAPSILMSASSAVDTGPVHSMWSDGVLWVYQTHPAVVVPRTDKIRINIYKYVHVLYVYCRLSRCRRSSRRNESFSWAFCFACSNWIVSKTCTNGCCIIVFQF